MTPARLSEIKERATLDVRALHCGYPVRKVPYEGLDLALYEAEYEKAAKAYGVTK